MNPQLYKRVHDDILTSGFGSEMKAISTFLAAGWGVNPAPAYVDADEGKTRSVDLSASKVMHDYPPNKQYYFQYHLLVEVKKSATPWVAFTQPLRKPPYRYYEGWVNPYVATGPFALSDLADVLSQTSLPILQGITAHSAHESFKKPDQPSRWYPAFITACKACTAYTKHEAFDKKYMDSINYPFLILVNPVVILDGTLLSAEIDSTGTISITERTMVPFTFEYGSIKYDNSDYRVDLVTLAGLNEYIEHQNKRFLAIYEMFLKSSEQHKS